MDILKRRDKSYLERINDLPHFIVFSLMDIEEIRKEKRPFDTMDMLDMYLKGVFDMLDFLNDIYTGNGEIEVTENFPYDVVAPEE